MAASSHPLARQVSWVHKYVLLSAHCCCSAAQQKMADWNRERLASAAMDPEEDDDPNILVCPITCEPIIDPVVDPEGFAYERNAILSWVTRHQTSPMTRSPLMAHELSPVLDNLRVSSPTTRTIHSIQLFVRTLSNKTRIVYVSRYASVQDLKRAIWDVEGIPVDQQRLLCSGKQLLDGKSLIDYKITEQSTIHLLLRLRGGGAWGM